MINIPQDPTYTGPITEQRRPKINYGVDEYYGQELGPLGSPDAHLVMNIRLEAKDLHSWIRRKMGKAFAKRKRYTKRFKHKQNKPTELE